MGEVVRSPSFWGQKRLGTVPLGENMKMIRFRGTPVVEAAREGRADRKGSEAPEMPSFLRSPRRDVMKMDT